MRRSKRLSVSKQISLRNLSPFYLDSDLPCLLHLLGAQLVNTCFLGPSAQAYLERTTLKVWQSRSRRPEISTAHPHFAAYQNSLQNPLTPRSSAQAPAATQAPKASVHPIPPPDGARLLPQDQGSASWPRDELHPRRLESFQEVHGSRHDHAPHSFLSAPALPMSPILADSF